MPEEKNPKVNFPLYIANRYLYSKSSNNAINIITLIAAIGIIVGAMSLFIVLSGFAGLKDVSLEFTQVFDADLKIEPASGKTFLFSSSSEEKLKNITGVLAFSKILEDRVFLNYKGKNHIAYLKGVDSNYVKVNKPDSILLAGDWMSPKEPEVVIGLTTANKLSLGMRDYIDLLEIYVPKPGAGQKLDPSQAFNQESTVVSGVYEVNEDLNDKYVFSNLDFARNLFHLDSTKISSIEIKLKKDASEEKVMEFLKQAIPQKIVIKTRIQQNDALYKMLNTEYIAVYLIFTLVLIIALFNVIGSIIMMILDKRKNIKTLFHLGATLKDIRKIFFLQGVLMSTLGGAFGTLLGISIVLLQLKFEFVNITATLPYPVKLKAVNVLIVFATISFLGIIASKIASSRVKEKLLLP